MTLVHEVRYPYSGNFCFKYKYLWLFAVFPPFQSRHPHRQASNFNDYSNIPLLQSLVHPASTMKNTLQNLGLAAILTLLASTAVNAACSTRSGVTITFYGYPDNDPPGPATAYNCGNRNYKAGGIHSRHCFECNKRY